MEFGWSTFGWASLAAAGAVVVVVAVAYAVAVRIGRHNVIDTAWGLGFLTATCAAAAVAVTTSAHPDGGARRLLITALAAVWALRLAGYVSVRSRGGREDPRYTEMLRKAPGNPNLYALRAVYLPQAVAIWFISLPLQVTVVRGGNITVLGWVGAAVWAVGFGFEAGGDHQLSRFKADPANEGAVLDHGLWRYTRHPNYFGDATQWWGFSLISFAHWPGVVTIASPLLMTWLLARKTGKPLLESRLVETRPGYADYVRRTSGFVPLPPKKALASH
ncbi:MAG: DUF1295 domain-containing protein [Acidothermaceae bacterium]